MPRIKPKLSADFEFFPVFRKEFGLWRDSIGGEVERFSFKCFKFGFHRLVGKARLKMSKWRR